MNAEITRLAPQWAKQERRRELRFWISLSLALVAIAAATWGVVENDAQNAEILEATYPCTVAPRSTDCATAREKISRGEPLKNACISFQRATGEQGGNCPSWFVAH